MTREDLVPKCPRCDRFDEVDRPPISNAPGRWICARCDLVFIGSAAERLAERRGSDPVPESHRSNVRQLRDQLDAAAVQDDDETLFADLAPDLIEDLAASGPDTRATGDQLAPASTVFARIAAGFAMSNPDASDVATVAFASEALILVLSALGARPLDDDQLDVDLDGIWFLDLDPESLSDEAHRRIEVCHGLLAEMTAPGADRIRTVSNAASGVEPSPGSDHPSEGGSTPETSNRGVSPPNLSLLAGGRTRTPFGYDRPPANPKDPA